jgi:RecA/RadA recombinase
MTIEFEGIVPDVPKFETGFWGFDYALRNQWGKGLNRRTIVEVYGYTGAGKSTLTWTLASCSAPTGKISIANIEIQDPDYMKQILEFSGFSGRVNFIGGANDEEILTNLANSIYDEDVSAGILDSVGAISPVAETEGDVGDANMGKRSKAMATWSRKVANALRTRKSPPIVFFNSHIHQIIGGRGTLTSGGETKKFMAATRLFVSQGEKFDDGSYLIKGKVEKNRHGLEDTKFTMFCLAGYGFHKGLSDVFTCVDLGLAKRDRTLKLNGTSVGFISKIIEAGKDPNSAMFIPFHEALQQFEQENK